MELVADALTKKYGDKSAVREFSANFTSGIHALLGPNGSGKTTLMRMLCDVLRPTSGEARLDGESISSAGEGYRELLGYLPQNFGCYPSFSGMEFMMYLAALKGLAHFTAIERCEELLRTVGLYDVRGKKLKTYSGGMKQRIGVAQALINDPKILILDEPTAGLDPKERTKFRNIIGGLSSGRIVILSTHIVSDVEYIADKVLFMKDGRLALEGDGRDIPGAIDGLVWTCRLTPDEAERAAANFVVSNLRHVDGAVEMRLVSEEKPFADAAPAVPKLEDLYLSHFREEGRQ